MNILVLFDSAYGNTKSVAQKIADTLASKGSVTMNRTGEADPAGLSAYDLVVVGSPTQGGRPTKKLYEFLRSIPEGKLKGVKAASFDTRFEESSQNFALKLLLRSIGYAAPKMSQILKSTGAEICSSDGSFLVLKTKGPLKDGELERAGTWASNLV